MELAPEWESELHGNGNSRWNNQGLEICLIWLSKDRKVIETDMMKNSSPRLPELRMHNITCWFGRPCFCRLELITSFFKTMSQALFYFLTLIGTKMNISPFKKEFKLRTEFRKIIRKVQESRKPRDIFSNF